jgi:hypothetical protein
MENLAEVLKEIMKVVKGTENEAKIEALAALQRVFQYQAYVSPLVEHKVFFQQAALECEKVLKTNDDAGPLLEMMQFCYKTRPSIYNFRTKKCVFQFIEDRKCLVNKSENADIRVDGEGEISLEYQKSRNKVVIVEKRKDSRRTASVWRKENTLSIGQVYKLSDCDMGIISLTKDSVVVKRENSSEPETTTIYSGWTVDSRYLISKENASWKISALNQNDYVKRYVVNTVTNYFDSFVEDFFEVDDTLFQIVC